MFDLLIVPYAFHIFVNHGFRDLVILKPFEFRFLQKKLPYHTRFWIDNAYAIMLFLGEKRWRNINNDIARLNVFDLLAVLRYCIEILRTSPFISNVVRNTFNATEIDRAFLASLSTKSGTPTWTNTLWHRALDGLPRNLDLTIIAFYIIVVVRATRREYFRRDLVEKDYSNERQQFLF